MFIREVASVAIGRVSNVCECAISRDKTNVQSQEVEKSRTMSPVVQVVVEGAYSCSHRVSLIVTGKETRSPQSISVQKVTGILRD